MGVSRRKQRGLAPIELIVALTILMLLATMAVPLARFRVRREREKELRWALAEIRKAIELAAGGQDGRRRVPGEP